MRSHKQVPATYYSVSFIIISAIVLARLVTVTAMACCGYGTAMPLRGDRHSLSPSRALSEHAGEYKELLCTHDVEMVYYLIRESVLHFHIVRER